MTACDHDGKCSPDTCLKAKLEYWRSRGAMNVQRPNEMFRSTTIREFQDDTVRRAKTNGYDVEPVGSRWV